MRAISGTVTEYPNQDQGFTPDLEINWQAIALSKPRHSGPVLLADSEGNFDFAWVTLINGGPSFNISGSMEYQEVTHWAWATKLG